MKHDTQLTATPSDIHKLRLNDKMLAKLRGISTIWDLTGWMKRDLIELFHFTEGEVRVLQRQVAAAGRCFCWEQYPEEKTPKRAVSMKLCDTAWAASTPDTCDEGIVYFIRNPLSDRIKIGYTRTLGARLADLETGAGAELCLVAALNGEPADERLLHRYFKTSRLFREWFMTDPVMSWLSEFQSHAIINLVGSRAVLSQWKK